MTHVDVERRGGYRDRYRVACYGISWAKERRVRAKMEYDDRTNDDDDDSTSCGKAGLVIYPRSSTAVDSRNIRDP